MNTDILLQVENLSVSFISEKAAKEVVHDISFSLNENEILGIVGESGSGKSVTALSVLGLLPKKVARITSGTILYKDENVLSFSEKKFREFRGNEISIIFQEPMSALNPSMRCGTQVTEILIRHTKLSRKVAKKETLLLFKKVKLPRPEEIYNSYPHQISGGQMQRVMIAMAIACKPAILIADEPTTALDVTVQKEIIALLKELQTETGMSILFISHNLTLVSEIADRVLVMYQGDIVEQGAVADIFHNAEHNYTKALLNARPSMKERLVRLPTIKDFLEEKTSNKTITTSERGLKHKRLYQGAPLLEVFNLKKEYYSNVGFFQNKKKVKAVDDVSFKVYEGETLGLVGESGCGKSTLGKTILRLEVPTEGVIKYRGTDITKLKEKEFRKLRKEIQIIFQDPYSSLNPRVLVGEAIMEPMQVHRLHRNDRKRKEKVMTLLTQVGLNEEFFYRYPHELSGGQRQRIGIARTIALEPQLVICDESVSALDISVQAQVLNLLNALKEEYGFTYIFISHDLAVVKYMADQLLVMNDGKIEEIGEADEIYANPLHQYTKNLIEAIPKGR